ncbi:hypothetical protein ABZ424_08665 [Streptomyces sp. NPDC005790]|uniref:hypothetical protein n=1 Tax=Streptomyces sp. NPDC005790 TaxID=3154777 RepID=UPI0033C14EAF
MKSKTIMQIGAAALIAVPSMVLVAVVNTAGTAEAAPFDPYLTVGSMAVVPNDGVVGVNFWQGISIVDESGDF